MKRPDYFVTPTYVLHVATQQRWNKPVTGNWNGISQAIKLADPGDTIGFIGEHEGVHIGADNMYDSRAAYWAEGPVHDLKIYGLDQQSCKIRGEINFQNRNNGAPYNIEFANYLHVVNGQRCIITFQHQGPFLGLSFKHILFDVKAENFTNGVQANDWIFRFHGAAQFEIESCKQPHRNQQHFVYADNVAGNSSVRNCVAEGNGRTMVQIVNRVISGPPGQGDILVERCLSNLSGHLDGASAFTCSGHINGAVTFRNCHTRGALGGSLAGWAESNNGSHLNSEGRAIDKLIVEDCNFNSVNADRDAMMISSCNVVELGRLTVVSNRDGLRLDHQQNYPNGKVSFTVPNPSRFTWTVPRKVIVGHDHNARVLTDREIDAMYTNTGEI